MGYDHPVDCAACGEKPEWSNPRQPFLLIPVRVLQFLLLLLLIGALCLAEELSELLGLKFWLFLLFGVAAYAVQFPIAALLELPLKSRMASIPLKNKPHLYADRETMEQDLERFRQEGKQVVGDPAEPLTDNAEDV